MTYALTPVRLVLCRRDGVRACLPAGCMDVMTRDTAGKRCPWVMRRAPCATCRHGQGRWLGRIVSFGTIAILGKEGLVTGLGMGALGYFPLYGTISQAHPAAPEATCGNGRLELQRVRIEEDDLRQVRRWESAWDPHGRKVWGKIGQ